MVKHIFQDGKRLLLKFNHVLFRANIHAAIEALKCNVSRYVINKLLTIATKAYRKAAVNLISVGAKMNAEETLRTRYPM